MIAIRNTLLKTRRCLSLPTTWLVLLFLVLVILFPFIWLALTSFKTPVEMFTVPPRLPSSPTFQHYLHLFGQSDLSACFRNSLIISLCATVVAVILGSVAAYSFARFTNAPIKILFIFFLIMRMMPSIIVALALFRVYTAIGLIDTKLALIITFAGYELPFVIWMMRSFIITVPPELEEASFIDGCSVLGAMRHIALPLALPGLAVTTILTFIFCWNEFLFALIFTRSEAAKTVPILIASFITGRQLYWGLLAAAGVVFTVPVLVFTLVVQRHIVRGLTLGAVKG